MDEKKIVEVSMDDLKKIVGGQGENETGLKCPVCGNREHFHFWRESPLEYGCHIKCLDCGWTTYWGSDLDGKQIY